MGERKKRILLIGEASNLSTGFAVYYRELIPRLVATGKYEIAEIGSYVRQDDPKVQEFIQGRWKFYGTLPTTPQEQIAFQQPSTDPRDNGQNINQFGAGVFDKAVADFQPDIVCVPPNELVFTSNGYKPIQSIKIGDYVLTHNNRFRPVINTMRRQHVGNIRSIHFNGCAEPLRLTDEHPVLVYRKRSQTNQKKRIDQIYQNLSPEFIAAKDVKKGDLVVLPQYNDDRIDEFCIDVTQYLDDFIIYNDGFVCESCHIEENVQHKLPQLIDITPSFGRLVGYLLSDGSYTDRSVNIFFGGSEKRFVDDAVNIFKDLGLKATYRYGDGDKDSYTVQCNSSLLAEFFRKFLDYKDSIPSVFWESPISVREQLIAGLVRGDGCYKKNAIVFSTTFRHLAYNIRMLYASLGIPSTMTKTLREDLTHGRVYEVCVSTQKYVKLVHNFVDKYDIKLTYGDVIKNASRGHFVNNHIIASVCRNRKTPYKGQVYNLAVDEDNSYVLQSCVHNCDIRDNWMLNYQLRSPFRDWFKIIWMPTVDAEPQKEEWIKDYENANLILSYSDYGIDTLKRQSDIMKVFPTPMRPGVDLKTFYPMDRKTIREEFCIAEDIPIIGAVMRNQSRKLFPDLLDAFALMKKKYEGEKQVDKAVLLLHSAWPDNQYSYDYPRHVMRLHSYDWMPYHYKGLKNHVMQSLMCHNCHKKSLGWVISLYGRPIENNLIKLPCMFCQQNTATCPTTGYGYPREDLAKLYNMMDLYVQCTICEGDGMVIQEAKACGVPTLVMDYTAMREKGRRPEYPHLKGEQYSCHEGGKTIDVGRYYYEPETSCMRALPDVEDLAKKMRDLINDPERLKEMGKQARQCAETNYDWDKLINNWEFVLDGIKPKDRSLTWETPIKVIDDLKSPPTPSVDLSDDEYVEWLYINILEYPRVDPHGAKMWLEYLKNGLPRTKLYEQFVVIAKQQIDSGNVREKIRADVAKAKGEYIEPSNQKEEWI